MLPIANKFGTFSLFIILLQVLGAVGALPGIFVKLEVSYYLLKRLLGVRTEGDKKAAKVQKLTKNEVCINNIIMKTYRVGPTSCFKWDIVRIF